MGEVWLAYLRTLVWPAQLSIVYEVPRRLALGLASALGWASLAGAAVLAMLRWRKADPVPLAIWLWLVLPLLPVSQVFLPLENVQADRYLWLSVLGLGLVLPALWQLHAGGRLVVLMLLTGCFGASVQRASAFGDGAELFAQATRATEGMRAPYLLARTLEQRGDTAGAEAAYWLTLDRPCEAPCEVARRASNNLARLLVQAGRADRAEPLLRQALERFPHDPKVHFNLVKVLERLGKRAEARDLYARAQAAFPHYTAKVR
jgi:tetratricopeptide (TPR) repeat protein